MWFRGDRVELLTGPDKGKQGYINYIVQVNILFAAQRCLNPHVILGEKLGYSRGVEC